MLDFIYKGFVHNGTVQNETGQNEVSRQDTSAQLIEERRRFVYTKAIEAYQFHIQRFHTWVNYYALFNGALLVAYCTLLSATNIVLLARGKFQIQDANIEGGALFLENTYDNLQFLIILLGMISSAAWLFSINGHYAWTINWLKIVEHYEREYHIDSLYRLLILDKKYTEKSNRLFPPFDSKVFPNGFSTATITKYFVLTVFMAWGYAALDYFFNCTPCCIIIIVVALVIILKGMSKILENCLPIWFYSDVSSKERLYE